VKWSTLHKYFFDPRGIGLRAQFLFQQLVERHRNLPGICELILDG